MNAMKRDIFIPIILIIAIYCGETFSQRRFLNTYEEIHKTSYQNTDNNNCYQDGRRLFNTYQNCTTILNNQKYVTNYFFVVQPLTEKPGDRQITYIDPQFAEDPQDLSNTVETHISPSLIDILYRDDHESISMPHRERLNLTEKVATDVVHVAELLALADYLRDQAKLEKNLVKKADLLESSAYYRLEAQRGKIQTAKLVRQLVRGRAEDHQNLYIFKIDEQTHEKYNAGKATGIATLAVVEKTLAEISSDPLEGDQLSLEIWEIKSKILESSAAMAEEEKLKIERKNEKETSKKVIIDRMLKNMKIERMAMGGEIRVGLMRLANEQTEAEIKNRLEMLGGTISFPINNS